MKPRPLNRYHVPSYPSRLEILRDPALLEQHLPLGWKSRAEIAGAAGLFLATNLSGCNSKVNPFKNLPAKAIVAPIFDHGVGRAGLGCVVVSPPVFLSEEEAWQVITEELARSGIHFDEKQVEWKDVVLEQRLVNEEHEADQKAVETKLVPMKVDGIDQMKRIAVEYVSPEDYWKLGWAPSEYIVADYDIKELSQEIDEKVKNRREKIYVGVFYDPAVTTSAWGPKLYEEDVRKCWGAGDLEKFLDDPEARKKCMEWLKDQPSIKSKELLREQIKDFADWLKAQGVI